MTDRRSSGSLFWPAMTFIALALLSISALDGVVGVVLGTVCAVIAVAITIRSFTRGRSRRE